MLLEYDIIEKYESSIYLDALDIIIIIINFNKDINSHPFLMVLTVRSWSRGNVELCVLIISPKGSMYKNNKGLKNEPCGILYYFMVFHIVCSNVLVFFFF